MAVALSAVEEQAMGCPQTGVGNSWRSPAPPWLQPWLRRSPEVPFYSNPGYSASESLPACQEMKKVL